MKLKLRLGVYYLRMLPSLTNYFVSYYSINKTTKKTEIITLQKSLLFSWHTLLHMDERFLWLYANNW
jgi:hypothetical protein